MNLKTDRNNSLSQLQSHAEKSGNMCCFEEINSCNQKKIELEGELLRGCVVVWLAPSPRNKRVPGSTPGWGLSVWSLHVLPVCALGYFRVLWLPPTVQKEACW